MTPTAACGGAASAIRHGRFLVAARRDPLGLGMESGRMIDWAHAGPSLVAAFLASLVEFIEALTVVLAVGTVRGWRPALLGTALGLAVLFLLVVILGPALALIPLDVVQLVVGTLLLLFGLRWLRKAILRAAGVIALHDEAQAFAAETALLRQGAVIDRDWDKLAKIG